MQDLDARKVMEIIPKQTTTKEIIIVISVLIGLFVLYQFVMLCYNSFRLNKIKNFERRVSESHSKVPQLQKQKRTKGSKVQNAYEEQDLDIQSDISVLLRGKKR